MHVALVNCDAGGYMTMMVTPGVNQATHGLSKNCDDAGYHHDDGIVDDDDHLKSSWCEQVGWGT